MAIVDLKFNQEDKSKTSSGIVDLSFDAPVEAQVSDYPDIPIPPTYGPRLSRLDPDLWGPREMEDPISTFEVVSKTKFYDPKMVDIINSNDNLSSWEKEMLLKEHEKQYHAAFNQPERYKGVEGSLAPIVLQTLHGDKSTVSPKVSFRQPPMSVSAAEYGEHIPEFNYDVDELTRRALVAKHGFEAKPSWNPFVHAGFTANMLKTGSKQLIPQLSWDRYNPAQLWNVEAEEKAKEAKTAHKEKRQKEYDKWRENYEIYSTADQPFGMQLIGDAMFGGANLAAAPARMSIGQIMKTVGLKEMGQNIINTAAFTGTTTPRNFLAIAGLSGGIEGAGFGASLPIDPSLPIEDQVMLKAAQTVMYGAAGMGGDWVLRKATTAGQKALTNKLRKEFGGTLPITPQVPTPVLYNQRAWFEDLKAWKTHRLPVSEARTAAKQINEWEDSMLANYRAMNREASGDYNEIPGGDPFKNALQLFLNEHNASWRNVAAKYDAVKIAGDVWTRNSTYQNYLKGLRQELFDKGFLAPENPVSHALKLMEQYIKEAPKYPSGDKDFAFSGRALNNIYKGLNNIMGKPSTERVDRNAIRIMKQRLIEYMMNQSHFFPSRTVSPQQGMNAIGAFVEATKVANEHYKKFDNSATVSKYINYLSGNKFGDDAEYTIADVSRSMFGSAALDFREVPKHRAIDQLLGAFEPDVNRHTPEQIRNLLIQKEVMRKALANEAFANFTDSFDRQRWIGAVKHINKRIIGGSDGEIYDNVFTPETKQQLRDFAKVYDMVNDPDFQGGTVVGTELHTDIRTTRVAPRTPILKHFAVPIDDPARLTLPRVYRSEKGTPSPSTSPIASGAVVPPALHKEIFIEEIHNKQENLKREEQYEKEQKVYRAKQREKRRKRQREFEKRMEEHRKRIEEMRLEHTGM